MLKTGFGTLVVIFDLEKKRKKPSALCNIYYTKSLLLLSHALFVFAFDWLSIRVFGFPLAHPRHPLPWPHRHSAVHGPSAAQGPPGKCICFNDHTWLHQQGDLEDPKQGPQLENAVPKEVCVVMKEQPRA